MEALRVLRACVGRVAVASLPSPRCTPPLGSLALIAAVRRLPLAGVRMSSFVASGQEREDIHIPRGKIEASFSRSSGAVRGGAARSRRRS